MTRRETSTHTINLKERSEMSSTLHFLPHELTDRLEPADLSMRYTSVERLEVDGESLVDSGDEEVLLVVIAGTVDYEGPASGTAVVRDMVYLPIHSQLRLRGEEGVVMRFGAPCDRPTTFAHLAFADADADQRHQVYGDQAAGTGRDVWHVLDESFDSQRFLAGLCTGRPGGWTAWPPHEHGAKREETYVYFGMGDSFGAQFVYDGDAMDAPDAVALVREGHVVSVPKGYHPSCGSPAGAISYAYVMVSVTPEDRDFMDLTIQPEYGETFQ